MRSKAAIGAFRAVCVLALALFAPGSARAEEEVDVSGLAGPLVETTLSLNTNYVFRGLPQYVTDDTPSLQADVDLEVPAGGLDRWWGAMWLGTALTERDVNAAAGTANEIDVSFGYILSLGEWSQLRLGAIGYFRTEDDPIDAREELVVRYEWTIRKNQEYELLPYVGLYGEVFRMLGAYGEVGVAGRYALEFGFHAIGGLFGGGSYYFRTGVDQFNSVGARVGLLYQFSQELEVMAYFNGTLTQTITNADTDFFSRHSAQWSGISLHYVPPF